MTYLIQIFCERPGCNVRDSKIITENSDRKVWRCPGCGTKAKRPRRLSLSAYQEEQAAAERRIKRLRDWR
jgi:hypothetical protein